MGRLLPAKGRRLTLQDLRTGPGLGGTLTKIVVLDDSPPVISDSPALVRLRAVPDLEVQVFDSLPGGEAELAARVVGAHTAIVIRSSTRVTHQTLVQAPTLKHVALWGPGTDHVDLDAARRLSVAVTNTADAGAEAVAEHALALLLAISHRLRQLDHRIRQGEWPRGLITQLHGKTLGVLGAGAVGRRMAGLGRGIGMRVLIWTLHPEQHNGAPRGAEFVELHTLLAESDAISVHLRGSADTEGILGAAELARMKPTSFVVNTGRGSVIDETALYEALRDGALAGAALDVFGTEPLEADNPLRSLANVILSPHTASTTDVALDTSLAMVVDNVLAFLAGEKVRRVA